MRDDVKGLVEKLENLRDRYVPVMSDYSDGFVNGISKAITTVRQHTPSVPEAGDDICIDDIIGTLAPIQEQDWHGKWRIKAAINMLNKAKAALGKTGGARDTPTDEEFFELAHQLWKLIKPSNSAQEIRASIKLDSGKYRQSEADLLPDYVWDLVDVAAEIGLTKQQSTNLQSPKREDVDASREAQQIEMLHGDTRRKKQMKSLAEENRRLREALHPGIKATYPLTLYFDNKADADEFIALMREARPGMKSYALPKRNDMEGDESHE